MKAHRPLLCVAAMLALVGCDRAGVPVGGPLDSAFESDPLLEAEATTDATPPPTSVCVFDAIDAIDATREPIETVVATETDVASEAEPAKPQGRYLAGSRIADRYALGGFSPCDNYPRDLGAKDWGERGAVSLAAFPAEPVAHSLHRGFALRLINRTDAVVSFSASDSRLSIVQEAQTDGGEWRDVESAPRSFCGNSHHRVFLAPGQYWELPARTIPIAEHADPTKTKYRFRLEPGDGLPAIRSNEFSGETVLVPPGGE